LGTSEGGEDPPEKEPRREDFRLRKGGGLGGGKRPQKKGSYKVVESEARFELTLGLKTEDPWEQRTKKKQKN